MIDFFPQVTKVNVLNYHDADILQSVMSAKELLKHLTFILNVGLAIHKSTC